MTSPVEMAALTIATHHISPKRAALIADHVIADLQRIGWGGRPDRISNVGWPCDWGGCDEETVGVRWDTRGKLYLPVCVAHLDADGATGGGG